MRKKKGPLARPFFSLARKGRDTRWYHFDAIDLFHVNVLLCVVRDVVCFGLIARPDIFFAVVHIYEVENVVGFHGTDLIFC